MSAGTFVVSLDFELHWGVRDLWSVAQYRENLLGARAAVPAMLDLFREHDVHATWAVVGFLCFESKRELLASLPARRPTYAVARLSPYTVLGDVGADEREDPFHFAPSLVRRIADTPGQELGTHTLSHYYCLEGGQSPAEFHADLEVAVRVLRDKVGRTPASIVFPRNQTSPEYLAVCDALGLRAYRGNPDSWLHRARARAAESQVRRAVRLADAYLPLAGGGAYARPATDAPGPVNVPASRYLRPWNARLRALEPLRLRRILADLTHAARSGRVYHLWWHPHDFGRHLEENLGVLRRILGEYRRLRERHGMESLAMGEVAAGRAGAPRALGAGGGPVALRAEGG